METNSAGWKESEKATVPSWKGWEQKTETQSGIGVDGTVEMGLMYFHVSTIVGRSSSSSDPAILSEAVRERPAKLSWTGV